MGKDNDGGIPNLEELMKGGDRMQQMAFEEALVRMRIAADEKLARESYVAQLKFARAIVLGLSSIRLELKAHRHAMRALEARMAHDQPGVPDGGWGLSGVLASDEGQAHGEDSLRLLGFVVGDDEPGAEEKPHGDAQPPEPEASA